MSAAQEDAALQAVQAALAELVAIAAERRSQLALAKLDLSTLLNLIDVSSGDATSKMAADLAGRIGKILAGI